MMHTGNHDHATRERGRGTKRGRNDKVLVQVDPLWWQVGCSGHAPPRVVEFAPPPPLATRGALTVYRG